MNQPKCPHKEEEVVAMVQERIDTKVARGCCGSTRKKRLDGSTRLWWQQCPWRRRWRGWERGELDKGNLDNFENFVGSGSNSFVLL